MFRNSNNVLLMLLWALLLQCLPTYSQIITEDAPVPTPPSSKKHRGETDDQLFLLLNAGLAAPAGVFGSTNILENDAVFAKTGLSISLNVGRTFNRFLGITATGGLIMQNSKMDLIVDNFNRYGPVNEYILAYDYPGMRFFYLAGGLLLTIPATHNFSIDVKMQGGVSLGVDKELTLQKEINSVPVLEKYGKASDIAFLPDLGLNFRVLVTDNFTMNFFTDFVMANYKFKDVTYYENGVPIGTYNYELPMRNINVGVGAGWSF